MISHWARICVLAILADWTYGTLNPKPSQPLQRVPKQIHKEAAVVETEEDHDPQETNFGADAAAGHHGHGKYFMDTIMIQSGPKQLEFGHVCENPHEWEQRYEKQDQDKKRYQGKNDNSLKRVTLLGMLIAFFLLFLNKYQHVPHKDHYEFGYRRGNDHHFKERYEKAHPHHGHFKTKARWGDKHGGYGEHYWDYNHGGHHGGDDASEDDGGDESNPVPDYDLKGVNQEERVKREHEVRRPSDSSEALDYYQDEDTNSPRYPGSSTLDPQGLRLAYDLESGTVVDKATGRRFLLTPIN